MTIVTGRLYQSIADSLKTRIANGEYQVGGKLPAERVIGQEFGVSRTVVREAIIALELEGVVSVRKGSGIQILKVQPEHSKISSEASESFVTDLIDGMEKTGPFEMLEARQHLESMIAELAATNATPDQIAELRVIQQKAASEDQARDSQWDKEFHLQIARASGNAVLAALVQMLWQNREKNPLWLNLHKHIEVKDLNSWYGEHEDIVEAIAAGNPRRAFVAMWAHIESTKNALYSASSVVDE